MWSLISCCQQCQHNGIQVESLGIPLQAAIWTHSHHSPCGIGAAGDGKQAGGTAVWLCPLGLAAILNCHHLQMHHHLAFSTSRLGTQSEAIAMQGAVLRVLQSTPCGQLLAWCD